MDSGIEQLAQKWEEQETAPEQSQAAAKAEPEKPVSEAAVNAGVWLVRGIELGWKAKEPALGYTEELIGETAAGFAPLLEKYGVGAGSADVPFREEISFGWSFGRLMKKSWLFVKAKAEERAKKKKAEEQRQAAEPAAQAAPADPYAGMFDDGKE